MSGSLKSLGYNLLFLVGAAQALCCDTHHTHSMSYSNDSQLTPTTPPRSHLQCKELRDLTKHTLQTQLQFCLQQDKKKKNTPGDLHLDTLRKQPKFAS